MVFARRIFYKVTRFLPWSAGAARTKYHRPGSLNNKHSFLIVLEAGIPKRRCAQIQGLVRTSSSSADGHLLGVCSHDIKLREKQALWHPL